VIKTGRRIDLGELFRSGDEGMLSEKVFTLFKKKIATGIKQSTSDEVLFLDLFEVNAIPKVTMAQELLKVLSDLRTKGKRIFFYNVSEEFYASLQQPLLSSSNTTRSNLIPFILLNGQWKWLGQTSDIVEASLNVIARNKFITTNFIRTINELSDAQLEFLRAVVDANPTYFIHNYKQGAIRCTFNINDVLDMIIATERKLITKAFDEYKLLLPGHYALPSGHHIDTCVLTSHISRYPRLSDRIYAQIARSVWAISPDFVITSSLFSFTAGEKLRNEQGQRVLNTFGYPVPRPRYGETTESCDRVFLLTDIYSTGASFNHIRKQVLANQSVIVGAMSVVDAHGVGGKDDVKSSIKLNLKLYPESKCPQCKDGKSFQFLDPFSCLPYRYQSRIKASKGILAPNKFWDLLREKDAIRGNTDEHLIYNGNHFTLFIETRKILRDESVARQLAAYALSATGPDFDAILIPKNEGALLLAHAIQEYLQHHFGHSPEVITCSKDHERNEFIVPDFIQKSLKDSSLLIVDDGANTGNTILGLHYAIEAFKPKSAKYLVFLDRLIGTDRQNIKAILKANYYCLFHLSVPVYREWDCPVCFVQENQAFYTRGQQDSPSEQLLPSRSAGPRRVTKLIWEADR
jgi:orotate phosphoribosyltransferase/anti-anti-sigma regulatory factor